MIHLQRGKGEIQYEWNDKVYKLHGLPDDGAGGYPTKNPKPPKYFHDPNEFNNTYTDFIEGKKRFDKDFINLRNHINNE